MTGAQRTALKHPHSVSVVVPTFNASQHIAETLDSVFAQDLLPVELIVVDDGSSDDTVHVIRSGWPSVILVEQANAGVSRARNHGLSLASGDLVCFLDQDDVWHPQQLRQQAECLAVNHDAVAVATPYWFCHVKSPERLAELPWPADPGTREPVAGYASWTYHQFLLDCWALTSATMIRRQPLLDVGGFDEELPYSEDWDLWLRLSRRYPFLQLAWPPVKYRQHPVQGSRQVRERDYRVELLQRAAREYGLCSPDGQCVDPQQFTEQVAHYRMEFGLNLASAGHVAHAADVMLDAWRMCPLQWKWVAKALALRLGWRPRRP